MSLIAWVMNPSGWFQQVLIVATVALALMWVFFDRIQARSSMRAIARARRSAEANRRLTDSLRGR